MSILSHHDEFVDYYRYYRNLTKNNQESNQVVNDLPEAKGEWIMNKTSPQGRNYTCTICKNKSRNSFHFCPNCGARMKGDRT